MDSGCSSMMGEKDQQRHRAGWGNGAADVESARLQEVLPTARRGSLLHQLAHFGPSDLNLAGISSGVLKIQQVILREERVGTMGAADLEKVTPRTQRRRCLSL